MKKSIVLFLLLLVSSGSFAQDPAGNAILGGTGSKSFTKRDFEERYEFTPTLYSQSENSMSGAWLNFAYSLLAEKLWALDAESRRLDTTTAIKISTLGFENMFIRDLMYQREIRDKATYTDNEYKEALRRQGIKYYVKYLFADDSTEIYKMYSLLQSGANFDTLLSAREEAGFQPKSEEVKYGQLADYVEDELYKLTVYQYTPPMYTQTGWYILYVESLTQQISINPNSDQDENVSQAKKVLKKRKENERYAEFFRDFFFGKKVETSAPLMKSLAVHLSTMLSDKKHKFEYADTTPVYLEVQDMSAFINGFSADSLKMPFITSSYFSSSFRDFLLMFAFDGYHIVNPELKSVFKDLQARTRQYIETTLLAHEGRKQGLDKDPEVIRQVNMWHDNYLYQMLRGLYADSVKISDSDLRFYYERYHKEYRYPKAVNIIEILTDSLQVVDTILAKAKQGVDFKELAHMYNKRASTKKGDGEYGYFPVERFGELGRVAWNMKEGEVFGPVKMPDGYSVIKLLGKREEYVEKRKKTFDEAKVELTAELRGKRIKRMLDVHTAELAQKYGITINADVFKTIQTTMIPAFAVRHLGFGGQITAVPLISPDNDWVDEFAKRTGLNP